MKNCRFYVHLENSGVLNFGFLFLLVMRLERERLGTQRQFCLRASCSCVSVTLALITYQ